MVNFTYCVNTQPFKVQSEEEIRRLRRKNTELQSELQEAKRDIGSFKQQIDDMNKRMSGIRCKYIKFCRA